MLTHINMKYLSAIAALILFSCGVQKDSAMQTDKQAFRVMKITDQQGGRAVVHLRRYQQTKEVLFECLPDSIEVGKYVRL
jgi:hypothetical protein